MELSTSELLLKGSCGASDCLTAQPGRQCRLLMAFEEACAHLDKGSRHFQSGEIFR
jgi:hypothetical protein